MPAKVTRQTPQSNGRDRPSPAAARPAGSVLSEAISVADIRDLYVKMVLYGDNGIGKTWLACDFEKPLLLLSFEPGEAGTGGARTVQRVPGVEFLRVLPTKGRAGKVAEAATAKLFRLAEEFQKGHGLCSLPGQYAGRPFRTVVIDSVTSLQDRVLAELMGLDWVPNQIDPSENRDNKKMYTTRAEQTKNCLKPWVDMPVHTIFIGKEIDHYKPEEPERDDKGRTKVDMRPRFVRGMRPESRFAVQLGGATAGWLNDSCDFLCRLYMDREVEDVAGTPVETGKFVRCLRIGFHPNYAARFRSPDFDLPDEIIRPTYAKIAAAIEGRYRQDGE